MADFKIFIIEYSGDRKIRIAKKTKEEAIAWFKEAFPHREILDIYEQ